MNVYYTNLVASIEDVVNIEKYDDYGDTYCLLSSETCNVHGYLTDGFLMTNQKHLTDNVHIYIGKRYNDYFIHYYTYRRNMTSLFGGFIHSSVYLIDGERIRPSGVTPNDVTKEKLINDISLKL